MFPGENFIMNQMMEFVFDWVENIVEKLESVAYHY